MQRNHCLHSLMVAISLAGFVSAVETAAENEPKGTKHHQQETRDTTTTKSTLEGKKKGPGNPNFKELNKHAPGGSEAAPNVQGHNKSEGTGTGTGAGTGTTGAHGGSGSGGGS
jgi:hypothetical protein